MATPAPDALGIVRRAVFTACFALMLACTAGDQRRSDRGLWPPRVQPRCLRLLHVVGHRVGDPPFPCPQPVPAAVELQNVAVAFSLS